MFSRIFVYLKVFVIFLILDNVIFKNNQFGVYSTPVLSNSIEDETVQRIPIDNQTAYVKDILRHAKAQSIKNFMNDDVDPCENFYEFACGKWSKTYPATKVATTGFFEELSGSMHSKVIKLLTSPDDDENTESELKLKHFYKSCMSQKDSKMKIYMAKLTEIISEFGTMPALAGSGWDEKHFDWVKVAASIQHKYGISTLFSVDLLADFQDNKINALYVGKPEFILETKSMYLDSSTAQYRVRVVDKMKKRLKKYLGLTEDLAATTAKQIMDFEIDLVRGAPDDKLNLGLKDLTERTTIDEMHQKYAPEIDVKKFLWITLGENYTEPIYEFVPSYQKNFVKVIRKTPKYIVANYIYYNLVNEFFPKVGVTHKDQQKICKDHISKQFSDVMDHMIYRRYSTAKMENDIHMVWDELKSAFKRELLSDKLNWINMETRRYAIEKLDAMRLEVNSYADKNFTEEYEDLEISSDDFIENLKNIFILSAKQELEELHEPAKPIEAGEVLAYTPANVIIENIIKIPVSLLQPYYLWADSYPNALKFGTLGFLIGHEMIHGFDDMGRKYDKVGNNKNWWDPESTASFEERTKCFIEQYHKYIFYYKKLPRSEAQAENIADNSGLKLAYDAYLKWYEESERLNQNLQHETLPRLNYTNKQLFFISFAQIWCSDIHPSVIQLLTSTDDHTPSMYRVIGSLSNFAEFSKEFNCPKDAYMNPEKRCEIY